MYSGAKMRTKKAASSASYRFWRPFDQRLTNSEANSAPDCSAEFIVIDVHQY